VRRRNAMTPNTMTVNDLDIGSCEFEATLDAVAEKSSWKKKYGKLEKGRGIGVGCGGFVSGAGYCIYRGQVQLSHEKPSRAFPKEIDIPARKFHREGFRGWNGGCIADWRQRDRTG
jgi:hypothetical protein